MYCGSQLFSQFNYMINVGLITYLIIYILNGILEVPNGYSAPPNG